MRRAITDILSGMCPSILALSPSHTVSFSLFLQFLNFALSIWVLAKRQRIGVWIFQRTAGVGVERRFLFCIFFFFFLFFFWGLL